MDHNDFSRDDEVEAIVRRSDKSSAIAAVTGLLIAFAAAGGYLALTSGAPAIPLAKAQNPGYSALNQFIPFAKLRP
ncbi:MAG TPA: hypothetical protein VIN59_07455 [Alphaproteobacteria bacterium]